MENEENLFDSGLYVGMMGTATALVLQVMGVIDQNLLAAYSSNLFGLICVAFVKIRHVRGYKRRLILAAQAATAARHPRRVTPRHEQDAPADHHRFPLPESHRPDAVGEGGAGAAAARPPVPEVAANTPPRDQDLVDVMRLSLADEQRSRDAASQQLHATQAELQAREQNIGQLQSARTQLESNLAATQQSVHELNQRVAAATQDAAITKEQLARMQRELEAEAGGERAAAAAARRARPAAGRGPAAHRGPQRGRARSPSRKRRCCADNLADAKQQVAVERQERQKVLAQTGQLAEGVGQLAEQSGQIAQEIRDNRPINANVLFNDFLANRVSTTLTASRKMAPGHDHAHQGDQDRAGDRREGRLRADARRRHAVPGHRGRAAGRLGAHHRPVRPPARVGAGRRVPVSLPGPAHHRDPGRRPIWRRAWG